MTISKKLSELIPQLPGVISISGAQNDPEISGIVLDSRLVKTGGVFTALVGGNVDGHLFIPAAVQNGAAAVLGSRELTEALPVPYICVAQPRLALAYLAAALYDFPARRMCMLGVTGTDGKTTTSNILYQILRTAGIKAGMISTVSAVIGERELDTGFHVTTPEAPDVQRYLAEMLDAGLTHVVLETTSHGLDQDRVGACEFDLGVVTNITHEHLDYHGSYEAYRAAKAKLFTGLSATHEKPAGNPRLAILNRDDDSYGFLRQIQTGREICYGFHPEADIRAVDAEYSPAGLSYTALGVDFRVKIQTRLVGAFNVSNTLAAFSAAVAGLGIDPQTAARGIAALESVPGRMERIDLGQDFTAVVDFAHTPNALENALKTVRETTHGRVIVVFGSAGLRDRMKRRMMPVAAVRWADLTILTAEDPRTEDLEDILEEMAAEARRQGAVEGKQFIRVADRGEAIRTALRAARAGDVVIACGKGHEQSMCFGTQEYAWDDRTAMRAALAELLGLDGPKMPVLPTTGV